MLMYGIAEREGTWAVIDRTDGEVVEFFDSQEAAEAALEELTSAWRGGVR